MRRSAARSFVCAALVIAVGGCHRQQAPAAPLTLVANRQAAVFDAAAVRAEPFFVAWTFGDYRRSPIPLLTHQLDARQYRVYYSTLHADSAVRAFAAAHRGHLYIHYDEPDQHCFAPLEYAAMCHNFVESIRAIDTTARFSPGGFSEPNPECGCPRGSACYSANHHIGYAQQFYDAYVAFYKQPPRVDEWRFHDFGLDLPHDVSVWCARVDTAAAWSVAHGAPMVLGSWGFANWHKPPEKCREHMREAMDLLRNDARIAQAAWWSYEHFDFDHFLAARDGALTAEGEQYSIDPGVMSLAIAGTERVRPADRCVWTAVITNGVAPFTFAWHITRADSAVAVAALSAASAVTYEAPRSDFAVQLSVKDRYGVTAQANRQVRVTRSAARCP